MTPTRLNLSTVFSSDIGKHVSRLGVARMSFIALKCHEEIER